MKLKKNFFPIARLSVFLCIFLSSFYCGGLSDAVVSISAPGGGSPSAPTVSDINSPSSPVSLSAIPSGTNQINLAWSASTDDTSAQNSLTYDVCFSDVSGGCDNFTISQTTTSGATSVTVNGLSPLTLYFFKVRATDQAGNTSLPSLEASATTDSVGITNAPSFSPPAGLYGASQNVAISSTTAGATVCYTSDGSSPSCNTSGSCVTGNLYTGAQNVASNQSINAIACAAGYTPSNLSTATYTMDLASPTTPPSVFAVSAGQNQVDLSWSSSSDNVTLPANLLYEICVSTTSGGCSIFNSSVTTGAGSTLHSVTGLNPLTTYYFAVRAVDEAGNISAASLEATAATAPVGVVNAPVFSPVAGIYGPNLSVTMSSVTIGSGVCYTSDGTTPSCNTVSGCATGTLYTAPVSVSASQTLNAVACEAGYTSSSLNSSSYTIDSVAPSTPTYPAASLMANSQVSLTWVSSTDNISLSSNLIYQICASTISNGCSDAAFNITATTLAGATAFTLTGLTPVTAYYIKVRAVDEQGNVSLVSSETTAITSAADSIPPVTLSSIPGGTYRTTQSVTLTCSDNNSGCQQIIYTTDGTVPSFSPLNGTVATGSTSGPIPVNFGSTILRFASMDNLGNIESCKEVIFIISNTGFTYVATVGGIGIGSGSMPASFSNYDYSMAAGNINPFFHDDVTGKFYLGTMNGLLISPDGVNWSLRTISNGLGNNTVNGVYANGNNVYVATGNGVTGGVSISTDGGTNFINKTTANGLGSDFVYGVYVAGNTIYAATVPDTRLATPGGLSISTDGGARFTNRTTLEGLGSNLVYGVYAVGNKVYAATFSDATQRTPGGGLSISSDGGITFINRTTADGLGSNSVSGVFVLANKIFVATFPDGRSSMGGGLSISSDGGVTFQNKVTTDGLGSLSVLNVYARGNTVYAATAMDMFTGGGGGVSISNDGGASFNHRVIDPTARGAGTAGVYSDGNTIYAATTSGLSVSLDQGISFSNRSTTSGLESSSIKNVYANGSTVYAATLTAGLSISTDGGISWVNKSVDNTGSCSVSPLTNNTIALCKAAFGKWTYGLGNNYVNDVYAVGNTIYAATNGGLSISNDGGVSFTNLTSANGLGNSVVYGVYAFGTSIYAATLTGLSVSTDAGLTWVNKTVDNTGTCSISPLTNNTLALCNTASGTWTYGLPNDYIAGVYALGTTIYVGTLNGLAISTDGGLTWVSKTVDNTGSCSVSPLTNNTLALCNASLGVWTYGLGNNVVLKVYSIGTTVYAATKGGLSISADSGVTWANNTVNSTGSCSVSPLTNNTLALCNAALGTWSFGLGDDWVNNTYATGTSVFASTVGGLSISSNSGTSFTNYTMASGLPSNLVYTAYYVP